MLGLLIEWHHAAPASIGPIPEEQAREIVFEAAKFARLDNLRPSTRIGSYQVRKTRNDFVLVPRWNPAIEVADIFLERSAAPSRTREPSEIEQQWIVAKLPSSRTSPPFHVLSAAANRSRNEIEAWRAARPEGSLPESFPLGDGLTIGHAIEVLAGIMGLADLCQFTAGSSKRTETTLVQIDRDRLIDLLDSLSPSCALARVDDLVSRLTYEPGRLPHNSPLVLLGNLIIICPPLIGSRLIDPIVLRAAGYLPARFGPIGHQLGKQAKKWAGWLRTIPGVLVAEEAKTFTSGGQQAGDLDIVAVDPVKKIVLCLEIKSPIDPWALTEVGKAEDQMVAACRQLGRRRDQLRSQAAACRFPSSWPDLANFTWTWAVGLPPQLCLQPVAESDICTTSLRFLLGLGTPPSLAAVVRTLDAPRLPVSGVHFTPKKLKIQLDRHSIHVDAYAMDPDHGWKPTLS